MAKRADRPRGTRPRPRRSSEQLPAAQRRGSPRLLDALRLGRSATRPARSSASRSSRAIDLLAERGIPLGHRPGAHRGRGQQPRRFASAGTGQRRTRGRSDERSRSRHAIDPADRPRVTAGPGADRAGQAEQAAGGGEEPGDAAAQEGRVRPEPRRPAPARPAASATRRAATVTLGDYFGKKPVIVTLVYYECPMLCNAGAQRAGAEPQGALDVDVGKEFEIVTVSIDPTRDARRWPRARRPAT